MSGDSSAKHDRRWAGWVLALVTLPALYLLAVPPTYCGLATNWGRSFPSPPPK